MKVFPHFVIVGFSNSYLIASDNGHDHDAVIIDPGIFDSKLLKMIEDNKLYIKKILVTHAHKAHIDGITTLLKIYDAKIYAFRDKILEFKTISVKQNKTIECGPLCFKVIETPGHSRDSLVFKIDNYLFTGDILTSGKIGSYVHESARNLILSSIREKLFPFGDETIVFPGHGPPTKLGIERLYNPALQKF